MRQRSQKRFGKETILRAAIGVAAIACGLLFVSARSESMMALLIGEQADYGDLMPELNVADFRIERVPESRPRLAKNETLHPDSASVLLIGDSFCRKGYDCHPFGDELSLMLDQPVLWWAEGNGQTRPFSWLASHGVQWSDQPRVLVLECVERNLVYYYGNPSAIELDAVSQAQVQDAVKIKDRVRDLTRRWLGTAETNYAYLMNTSFLTSRVIESLNTFKYHQFGILPQRFQVHSKDPPMVFTYFETAPDQNTSYFYDHTESTNRRIAQTIGFIREELKRQFNLDLLFLIVPNKISIYHESATAVPYDNFLPLLKAQLDSAGVNSISLYEPFRASGDRLYFVADTHWNRDGLMLGARLTAHALRQTGFPQTDRRGDQDTLY